MKRQHNHSIALTAVLILLWLSLTVVSAEPLSHEDSPAKVTARISNGQPIDDQSAAALESMRDRATAQG